MHQLERLINAYKRLSERFKHYCNVLPNSSFAKCLMKFYDIWFFSAKQKRSYTQTKATAKQKNDDEKAFYSTAVAYITWSM